jgi:hypothetical protein
MALSLFDGRGAALDQQICTWRELVQKPISKLDDDAFTRVRIILMNGVELEALRFKHSCARMNAELRAPLAQMRAIEQQQATAVNWLLGADHSPLEITIAYEQVAIEVTAAIAQREPDPYLAQGYRFGLLEDFDHLYRYSALLDRLEGKDANNILQCYTDILPGRPTLVHHRAPIDNLRTAFNGRAADPVSKMNAMTLVAGEQQTHNYYMNIGPTFADPLARQLYAEIASVEEEHVTQYESTIDPNFNWLEQWLLHEANEAYLYYSCVQDESNPRIRALWERLLDYELGQFRFVADLFKQYERRDPAEIVPATLPEPMPFASQRDFVRDTLSKEVDLRTNRTQYVPKAQENMESIERRELLNSQGSPSETVALGYQWEPGTELRHKAAAMAA